MYACVLACECVKGDLNCTHLNYALIFFFPSASTFLSRSLSNCERGLALSLFIFLTVILLLLTAVAGINGRPQEVKNHETTQSGPFLNTTQRLCVCVSICVVLVVA